MNKISFSVLLIFFLFSTVISQAFSFSIQPFQNLSISQIQTNPEKVLFEMDFNDITKEDFEHLASLIGNKFVQILDLFEYNLMQSNLIRNLTLTDLKSISNFFYSFKRILSFFNRSISFF